MILLKFIGRDELHLISEITQKYGKDTVINNLTSERESGVKGYFCKKVAVATICLDDGKKEIIKKTVDLRKETSKTMSSQNATLEDVQKIDAAMEGIMSLQKDFDQIKQSLQSNLKNTDSSKDSVPYQYEVLKESMLDEGIHRNVVAFLLKGFETMDPNLYEKELKTRLQSTILSKENVEFPKTVVFVGSTGVGKTTTIAKLVAQEVQKGKEVVLFAADGYRIGARDQLQKYADILNIPMHVVSNEETLLEGLKKWSHVDHLFVDTAGRSHKNKNQIEEIGNLVYNICEEKEVFLTINLSTSYNDIRKIVDTYEYIEENFSVIITKLDETDMLGNLVNIAYYIKRPITYITNGQSVPKDIMMFNSQVYIQNLLGRLRYE